MRWRQWSEVAFAAGLVVAWLVLIALSHAVNEASRHWVP